MTWKRLRGKVTVAIIVCAAIVNAFPIYWMILTSFRPEDEIVSRPPKVLPIGRMTTQNYRNVLTGYSGTVRITEGATTFLQNSLIVATVSTFLTLLLAAPAAYALVRLWFPGREVAAASVLICYLVPPLALIVPVFVICVRFGLQNSLIGLTLVECVFNLPIALWLMRGYLVGMPVEVEEAAEVDGCTRLQVVSKIVLPMALPGVTVVTVVCFLNAWNSYLFPLILIRQEPIKTAALGLAIYLNEQIGMVWGEMMAAGTIIAIPIILMFLVLHRYLTGGITVGAVKG
jgi:ABC-type glycerol-3-phosphate transport system permease component